MYSQTICMFNLELISTLFSEIALEISVVEIGATELQLLLYLVAMENSSGILRCSILFIFGMSSESSCSLSLDVVLRVNLCLWESPYPLSNINEKREVLHEKLFILNIFESNEIKSLKNNTFKSFKFPSSLYLWHVLFGKCRWNGCIPIRLSSLI